MKAIFLSLLLICNCISQSIARYNVTIGSKFELFQFYGNEVQFNAYASSKEEILDLVLIRNLNVDEKNLRSSLDKYEDTISFLYLEIISSNDITDSIDEHKFFYGDSQLTKLETVQEKTYLLTNGTIVYKIPNFADHPQFFGRGWTRTAFLKSNLLHTIFLVPLIENNSAINVSQIKLLTPVDKVIEFSNIVSR